MKVSFCLFDLKNISRKARKEAIIEMLFSVIFSTLPIWFSGIIVGIKSFFKGEILSLNSLIISIFTSTISTISNGELLMYAAATLGPTLYIGLTSIFQSEKPFPGIRMQFLLAILINFFGTVMFFESRADGFTKNILFIILTTSVYLFSLYLLYPSIAFDKVQKYPNASEAQKADTDSYISEYREHKKQQEKQQ